MNFPATHFSHRRYPTGMVVTYGATHGDKRLPQSLSLCPRHADVPNRLVGYANVNHGLHAGTCTDCESGNG
jgi:hypothetical protein